MGYTHYWKAQDDVDDAAYTAALKDIAKIVKSKAKILAGPFGEKGTLPKTTGGIAFNGIEDDSHETFDLPASAGQLEDFSFCKTARKPYDIVVVAALTRLAEVPGISISSDGNAAEWKNGVSLAEKVLGKKFKNPMTGEDEVKKPKEKSKLKLVKSYVEKIQAYLGDEIEAKYEEVSAAKKIPSYTDELYKKEFKFPKTNINETATHSYGNNGAKIVISLFPEWTKEEHLAAAAKHEKDADKMDEQWAKLRDDAHQKTFGKPAEFHDYKISGIGRSEYPEEMKDKLRELAQGATKARALSYAHATAAKLVNRIKYKVRKPVN